MSGELDIFNEEFERQKRAMDKEAEEIYQEIVVDSIHSKISIVKETIFEHYFLPRMLGEIDDPRWTGYWLGISITPSARVTVVDDVTDEPLFVVPPIMNSMRLKTYDSDESLKSIAEGYEMRKGNQVHNPNHYLSGKLNNMLGTILSDYDPNEFDGEWRDILIRYGRIEADPVTPEEEHNDNEGVNEEGLVVEEEIEFDYD